MKCFIHNTEDAVGICKSCGKGLCHKCAAELPNAIACKDSCEKRVELINNINAKIITNSNSQRVIAAYSGIILGVLFIVLGIIYYTVYKTPDIGIIFTIMGITIATSSILRVSKKNTVQDPATGKDAASKK